jgi:hypothetical protein
MAAAAAGGATPVCFFCLAARATLLRDVPLLLLLFFILAVRLDLSFLLCFHSFSFLSPPSFFFCPGSENGLEEEKD